MSGSLPGSGAMSDKKFYLSFVDAGVRGIIDLYWETAPKTCDALWGALQQPISVPASHAMFSSPDIMMGLPQEAQTFDPTECPPEKQTFLPEFVQVLWLHQPTTYY